MGRLSSVRVVTVKALQDSMTQYFSTQSSTVRFVCRQLGTGCLGSGTPNRPNVQGFAVALLQKQDIQPATGCTVEEK